MSLEVVQQMNPHLECFMSEYDGFQVFFFYLIPRCKLIFWGLENWHLHRWIRCSEFCLVEKIRFCFSSFRAFRETSSDGQSLLFGRNLWIFLLFLTLDKQKWRLGLIHGTSEVCSIVSVKIMECFVALGPDCCWWSTWTNDFTAFIWWIFWVFFHHCLDKMRNMTLN